MTLSKRERSIVILVAASLALLVLDRAVISPYLDTLHQLDEQKHSLEADQDNADDLFRKQRRLQKVWDEMQAGGLRSDASAAESQALHAIVDWTQSAGLNLTSLKPERNTQQGQFEIIGYRLIATGGMRGAAQLVWALEMATIPVRVTDIQITPRREGQDDLSVQIGVTTLCLAPPSDKTKPGSNVASAGANIQ